MVILVTSSVKHNFSFTQSVSHNIFENVIIWIQIKKIETSVEASLL